MAVDIMVNLNYNKGKKKKNNPGKGGRRNG